MTYAESHLYLRTSSGELILEHAQPVGAVVVRTVAMESPEGEPRDIDRPVGARTVQ